MEALELDASMTRKVWRDWLANHGLAAISAFSFTSLGDGWLRNLIRIATPETLKHIAAARGLILTAHCQHQNLIAAYLGHTCGDIYPLAASPASSPLYPWIGENIERLNEDSERWFGNGRYLFIEQHHATVRAMHAAFTAGAIVLAVCDIHVPQGHVRGQLFGRTFSPPLGALRAALHHGVPVHAALMLPDADGVLLHLEQLKTANASLDEVLSAYCTFVEAHVRACPAAWQGWEWWISFPRM